MRVIYNASSRYSRKLTEFLYYYLKGKIHRGYCPICESHVFFIKKGDWLRDFYFCRKCNSIPRQRALVAALNLFYPDWKNLRIHESSPGGASSNFIEKNCSQYVPTHFFQDTPLGKLKNGVQCENLEEMTFEDSFFDLIITQDVFEHVMNPAAAFKEINRVLKPGGAHIFTMPWYPNLNKTVQRAKMVNGEIEFLEEPIYHGNPIDADGSLVTFDWGIDFTDYIYRNSGMFTTIYLVKNEKMGLEAEFLEVFISRKY
jgi:SAM-dependent methyltransferase